MVAGVDAAAQALGLMPGMALAHAMALVPGLDVREADPAAEAAALARMAQWCRRVTPLVGLDAPDGLWLDVTGCAHLHGDEAGLLRAMLEPCAADGITARAALADTAGAAHALARHSPRIVPPGEQAAALAPLPVRALRLPPETVVTLRRLGLERIGDLMRMPRAGLARRLGPQVTLRLDQALGRAPEPLAPLPHPETLQHRVTFVEPLLTPDSLAEAIRHLAPPLCAMLEAQGLGARRLDLLFERVDGEIQAIRIGTARPSRDAGHLARLLEDRLDQVDPGLGVEAMRLVAPLAEALHWAQLDDKAPDISTLVDRLSNRLGADRVYRVEPVESDVPERSVRRIPALAPRTGRSWPLRSSAVRLLDPPRPVDALALLPDQPPAAFTWQRRRHRVRQADGPERIHAEWWRRDAETHAIRDYFQVEDDEGRRFWLFRRGDGVDPRTGGLQWYVHGLG